MRRRLRPPLLGLTAVAAALLLTGCTSASASAPSVTRAAASRTASPSPTSAAPTPTPTPTFDRSARSIDDPTSLWVIVDKLRPLHPASFVPPDLVPVDVPHTNAPILQKPAALAVERMFAAARADGIHLASNSTYRPYDDQRRIYDGDVQNLGVAGADRLTARPGYSEHQTGLAIDIGTGSGRCDIDPCFGGTPEGRWLAANACHYGFVLRYPQGQEPVTGIEFEPWHYRYVGIPLAADYHRTGATSLEQYFGLPPSPHYR
ncbi:MAG: M15 family metallopeptidase [Amnibacterium sp.]